MSDNKVSTKRKCFVILLMLGLLISPFCSLGQNSYNIQAYFPLIKDAKYFYKGYYSDKEVSYGLGVQTVDIDGYTGYYFEKIPRKTIGIGANVFWDGVFIPYKNQVFGIEAYWKYDLWDIHINENQLLFPSSLSRGDSIKFSYQSIGKFCVLTIEGLETITVPAGEFRDCLKIKKHNYWDTGGGDDEFIWLAKDVGMVQWIRVTGRIEKLVSFSFPEQ